MKNCRKEYSYYTKKMRRDVKIGTFILVAIIVLVFILLQLAISGFFNEKYIRITHSIGMIIPMLVIFSILNNKILARADNYFTILTDAIDNVAKGNFDYELAEDPFSGYAQIYDDFNKMIKELKGVQTLRNDFVNLFSHEFKTPIMSINGFAAIMLEEELPRDEQIQYLKIIESESARLAELSKNTLLLAKLESQELVYEKEVFSLDEQIKESIILLDNEWSKKNIELEADLDSLLFLGNREIVKQLWINLLSNAINYTPPNGSIQLTLRKDKGFYVVRIKDSGLGIPEEEISKIFNKYYKVETKITTKGLGLGLSIVKKIVELCSGKIEVTSIENIGTEFVVYLNPNEGEISL